MRLYSILLLFVVCVFYSACAKEGVKWIPAGTKLMELWWLILLAHQTWCYLYPETVFVSKPYPIKMNR